MFRVSSQHQTLTGCRKLEKLFTDKIWSCKETRNTLKLTQKDKKIEFNYKKEEKKGLKQNKQNKNFSIRTKPGIVLFNRKIDSEMFEHCPGLELCQKSINTPTFEKKKKKILFTKKKKQKKQKKRIFIFSFL